MSGAKRQVCGKEQGPVEPPRKLPGFDLLHTTTARPAHCRTGRATVGNKPSRLEPPSLELSTVSLLQHAISEPSTVNGSSQPLAIVSFKCCGAFRTLRHQNGDDGNVWHPKYGNTLLTSPLLTSCLFAGYSSQDVCRKYQTAAVPRSLPVFHTRTKGEVTRQLQSRGSLCTTRF